MRNLIRPPMAPAAALLLSFAAGARASSEAVTVGPWHIEADEAGAVVRVDDVVVLAGNYAALYEPGWKGALLNTSGAALRLRHGRNRVALTWTKSASGVGRAEMALGATPDAVEFTTALRTQAHGPVEIGFFIPADSLWRDRRAVVETSALAGRVQQHFEVADVPFEALAGLESLTCEAGDYILALSLRASRGEWVLQDFRRTQRKAVRLVMSAQVGEESAEVTGTAILRVRKIGGEVEPLPRAENLLRDNPGFEDGPDGWQCPENATPDADTAIQGRRSMRMTVMARGEPVYITRMVPVAEGRRYGASALVKTDDVRPLPPGPGYSSTGATVIVEWADGARKWLAPGAYGAGVYGTSDWREVQVRNLSPAPEGARYAIVFLSLRAIGTAWFDDVRFYEVPQPPVRLDGPADGAMVADNRPLFRWQPAPVPGYVLQLCTDNAFMGPLIEAHVQSTSWRPPQPLAQGQWYWRVARSTSSKFSKPFGFTQTADRAEDTTGPTLCLESQSLSDSAEPLRIRVNDPSGPDPKSLRVWVDGRSLGKRGIHIANNLVTLRRPTGWRPGLHWLRLRAADARGNVTEDECPFVFAKVGTRYSFRRDGVLLENGRAVFPFGIYQIDEEDMANAKRLGFDLVHNYRFEGSQDDQGARDYLDAAAEHGLKVFMGFDRGKSSGNGLMQGNLRMLARRVGTLMDHPALAAWYLYDEPEVGSQYVSPAQLRTYYDTIKGLDPYHPVCVVVGWPNPSSYRGAFDWFWSEEYSTARSVATMMRKRRKALRRVPICAIVHCYDRAQTSALRAGQEPSPARFRPTPTELRANAYTAITQGSNGLLYWWYGDGGRNYYALGEVPSAQEALKGILAEIRSLEPYLVADAPVIRPDYEPADSPLYLWAKEHEGRLLLIAVNPAEEPLDAKIDLHRFGATEASVLFEGRQVAITGGVLEDGFAPLAVHVYQLSIEGADSE
ncbi:MAG: hypothetical protein ACE5O2_06420 [Armatimonadota bacterium]